MPTHLARILCTVLYWYSFFCLNIARIYLTVLLVYSSEMVTAEREVLGLIAGSGKELLGFSIKYVSVTMTELEFVPSWSQYARSL